LTYFDKDTGAIGRTHDQVDFATTAPRGSIIALKQTQTGMLQMRQRQIFSPVAQLFGAGRLRCQPCFDKRYTH
jgi:hypothetical protein